MSCEHPENNPEIEEKFNLGGTIVLTKNDINRIRNYEVLEYHFHGKQFHHGRITFFISKRKNIVSKYSNLGQAAMKEGEVCPLIIDEKEMAVLKKGDRILSRIIPSKPVQFQIDVCTSSQWHRKAMEQNQDAKT